MRVAYPFKVTWLLEDPTCKAADCFISPLLCHPHTKQTRRPHIPEIPAHKFRICLFKLAKLF